MESIFSDAQLKTIVDATLDLADKIGDEEVAKTLSVSQRKLRYFAQKFLNEIKKYEKYINDYETVASQRIALNTRAKAENFEAKTQSDYWTQQKDMDSFMESNVAEKYYKAVFDFQKELNAMLGQTVKMCYVYDNGDRIEVYEIDTMDGMKYGYTQKGKLTGRYSSYDKLVNAGKLKQIKTNKDTSGLDSTYREVMYRFGVSKARNKKAYIVLWYLNNRWSGVKVYNKGDIRESYASFYINRLMKLFKKDMENNVRIYMTHSKSGVSQVDGVSGLLEGDVSGDNGIEYGIKSQGASTLKVQQLKDLAHNILKNNMSKKDLEEYKEKKSTNEQLRNKLINMIKENEYLDLKKDIQIRRNLQI